MTLSDAASTYVLLAIGDALVAQIPALLLSIAAAAIVTRVSSPLDLSHQITSQFGSARAWTPVAIILALLGVLPGMPHFVILPAAALAGYTAWRLRTQAPPPIDPEAQAAVDAEAPVPATIGWEEVSDGAALSLELGYGLIGLVDERKGAPLMGRITGIRRQLSRELGFVVPLVRVRDNLALEPNSYRISVAGVVMARINAGRKIFWRWMAEMSTGRCRAVRSRIRASASTLSGYRRNSGPKPSSRVIPWSIPRP